jgi:DNA-directed RNA polymerase specialized sigma24 family protein
VAEAKRSKERHQISAAAALAGILALLADEREERIKNEREATKTEVLLAEAGLSLEDIAAITGKNYDAVRMAIARSRRRR